MSRAGKANPTITDIAEALGVSRATVSRAFSRPDLIGAATVQRVREMAEKIGYVTNPLARALSTGRQGNLAIIVPDIANPFFPPLIRAVQRKADERGFGVFIGDTDGDAEREYRLAMRLAPQIEGFVLMSSRMADARIHAIAEMRPVVLVNRDVTGLARVLIDPTDGMEQAVAELAGLGHRRLAYVAGPQTSWSDSQRRIAIAQAAQRHDVEIVLIDGFGDSFEGGRAAAPEVLAARVTGAIAFDDFVAHGLLAGLAQAGRPVPDTFSLVGFDDVLGASTYPSLSSVHAPGGEAGERAIAMLMEIVEGEDVAERCERFSTRFIARATSAKALA